MRQFLENNRGIKPRERGAADIVAYVDAAEPELRRLPQRVDREYLALIPGTRVRHHFGAGELARRFLKGQLFFTERKIHSSPTGHDCDSGDNPPQLIAILAVAQRI